MTVENVTYIDDLDPAYPDGTDSISEGDNHIRNLKKSIKATFPSVKSEVPLVVKGDGVTGFESSTEFGAGPDSNHNFVGDVFVGYDSPIAQPDKQNGTLLCARGVLIGRGGAPGEASIGMEGNIIWGLGDAQADDHAVSYGFLKKQFSGIEIDTNVSNGEEDGETIAWNAAAEQWQRNDLLKVQPTDMEVVVDGMMVSQPALIEQSTGDNLGQVEGHNGFYLRSRRFENANDPWSGTSNQTWEIASIEPRDDAMEPSRRNGIDLTADRVTLRVNADWSATDWYETQIVFRADGEEVEIGARNNTTSVFTNGDVYVGHQPDNRPDNNDVADGTLFVKQGLIVGRGNPGGASIGMENNIIWGLADPTDDSHAVSKGWLEKRSPHKDQITDIYNEQIRQAIVIDNHENRLDRAEPKITKLEQDVSKLQSSDISVDPISGEIEASAPIDLNGNRLHGLPAPTRADDAVTLSYFEANQSGGTNPPPDNLMNGTEVGQLVGWNGTDKYVPQSFIKFKSGPDRLEATEMWVTGSATRDNSVITRGHLNSYLKAGTDPGDMAMWDGSSYVGNRSVRYFSGLGSPRLHVENGIAVRDSMSANIGYSFDVVQYNNADDPWTGGKINLNSLQIMPYNDNPGSGVESGVSILGDRFTVRVPAFGDDPYNGEIAFRVRELECVIGVDSYSTTTIIQGDTYVGYKRGEQPDNADTNPGTLFTGGILVGRDKPVGQASIGMEGNIIWGLGDPSDDTHAVSKGWLEKRSPFKDSIDDIYAEQIRQAVVLSNHENRLDAVEPKVEKNKSDIANLQSSQAADNQQISDLFDEQVRQAMILGSHDNRLDALEPKVAANESSISSLSSTVTSHGNIISSHAQRLDGVDYTLEAHYNELVKHALQIQQLQNATREAVRNASNFDEFKQAMMMLLDNAMEAK